MSAGKGDKPRNCFSKQYRDNYDQIDWSESPKLLMKVADNTYAELGDLCRKPDPIEGCPECGAETSEDCIDKPKD